MECGQRIQLGLLGKRSGFFGAYGLMRASTSQICVLPWPPRGDGPAQCCPKPCRVPWLASHQEANAPHHRNAPLPTQSAGRVELATAVAAEDPSMIEAVATENSAGAISPLLTMSPRRVAT